MIQTPGKIVVVHTAFIGDIILALPLVQVLRSSFPRSVISFVTTPTAAGVLHNHPAIDTIIIFDKRGDDRGVRGLLAIARRLRSARYDIAIVPHRSLRSAALAWFARIPARIGFTTSSGRWLYTERVRYDRDEHEIQRNLALLAPLSITPDPPILPEMYPDNEDRGSVTKLLVNADGENLIALAPGSIWNTKRWPREYFVELGRLLAGEGFVIVLIGSRNDAPLCAEIADSLPRAKVVNTAGQCSLLQSAEVIRRCKAIVTNDSAPMHMGVAMETPVIAIFGATDPKFGFAPRGRYDAVVETRGLPCRPCSIHGGERCPIGTFECMRAISPGMVLERVHQVLAVSHPEVG